MLFIASTLVPPHCTAQSRTHVEDSLAMNISSAQLLTNVVDPNVAVHGKDPAMYEFQSLSTATSRATSLSVPQALEAYCHDCVGAKAS